MSCKRRKLIRRSLGAGLVAGLFGLRPGRAQAATPAEAAEAKPDDWHAELTKRVAELEARGGGTLELADGVYEIGQTLRLPRSVSLTMTPNAVLRAKSGFAGDAVLVKGGGTYSKAAATAGWIRGGVVDGNRLRITGIRVEDLHRLEIADLSVLNALQKGVHLLKGGNETNLTRVRCDVDMNTPYAPGSIGIHVERTDCKFHLLHVIGYETGIRSDASSNWFSQIHVWNWEPTQGPLKICYYCNGTLNCFSQCYADSPTEAGFYMAKPYQSLLQCRVYFSQWAKDGSGVGIWISPDGKNGTYLANAFFAKEGHRLAKAFDGNLGGATILGSGGWGVLGGLENHLPAGAPALNVPGGALKLTPQTAAPDSEQGELGEVRWMDDGQTSALWVKTSSGWKKSALT